MWEIGATVLYLISECCWALFLFVSVLLQLLGPIRDEVNEREMGNFAGKLPNLIKAGGYHKILVSASQNIRHLTWQKLSLGSGTLGENLK